MSKEKKKKRNTKNDVEIFNPSGANSEISAGENTLNFTPSASGARIDDPKLAEKLRRSNIKKEELRGKLHRLPRYAAEMWKAYRADASIHVREGLIGFGFGICAYLLGCCKLPFNTYPLGLALLCSSPKKMLWIFFGLCAAAFSLPEGALVYIIAYATAVSVRILARLLIDIPAEAESGGRSAAHLAGEMKKRAHAIFTESIYLRMATACASAFVVGLYFLVSRGFVFYDLFAAIFAMLCTPAAVFVYSGCFEENSTDARFRHVAIGALTVSLTYALREMSFIGISLGIFFAFFVTVYATRNRGAMNGIILGLALGVAYAPKYAPMFALAGLCAHLMWNISSTFAMTAASAVSVLWGIYVEGVGAVSHILPAVMLASAAYIGASKLSFFPAAKDLIFSGRYCADMNDADISRFSQRECERHLSELSENLETLSEIFYNLSDRLCRPGIPELRRMCDSVYDQYCPYCENKAVCWELEYSQSADVLGSIGDILASRGIADVSDLPSYMQSRCTALPGIINEINQKSRDLSRVSCLADKTEVFAMDYAAIARLISDTAAMGRDDMIPHRELSEKLTEVLAKYGFGDGGVSVYGRRSKRIIARGFDTSGAGRGVKELKADVERVCGFAVSDPIIELSEGAMTLKMSSARSLSARCVLRTNNTGQEECGDTVASFEASGDRHYVLISDGMGRGREAAFTSGVCSMFLQKLLGSGNLPESVIKMLGGFVRSKPGECSATIDLLSVDLLSGRTEFYKCGAPASFVRRGENIFKLASNTVPLGILSAGDIGKLSFDANAGDFIIMLSDGVAMGNDDSIWLLDLLGKGFDKNLEVMAEKIIAEARRRGSDDDISVALIAIEKV